MHSPTTCTYYLRCCYYASVRGTQVRHDTLLKYFVYSLNLIIYTKYYTWHITYTRSIDRTMTIYMQAYQPIVYSLAAGVVNKI